MAGQNRLLRGNTQQARGKVRANTVVEPGDFVCINTTSGYFGNSSSNVNDADYFLYPLSSAVTTVRMLHTLAATFMGVAMTGSKSGTTDDVVVAVDGIFRYPIKKGPSAVTVGARVSAVSYAAGSGSSNQAVANHGDVTNGGTTVYLGVIVKTESGASYVDFELINSISGGSIA